MVASRCGRSWKIGWTSSVGDVATLTAAHGGHDRLLIAATVGRGALAVAPPSLARALLAACTECARLHADLLALALALPIATTPARPRDFTLTAADAERLRPRGLRRWLALIGTSRDTITRPLAIGFTTLGLAGLLVATVPGALPGSGDSATRSTVERGPQLEIQSAASSAGTGAAGLGDAGLGDTAAQSLPLDPGPPPVVVLSVAFLSVGGGLFAGRRLARSRPIR